MNSFSVNGKNWISKDFNSEDINFFKTNYFLDEIVAKLLSIRKIKKEDVKSFLEPTIKNILPNPYILKDMDTAIERTEKSIINKEKIGIFGDYDVDGATSTAILGKYFEFLNIPFEIHIPDRKKEGFGPNQEAFLKFINLGVNLIFTVDCGTLSYEPMDFAKKNNHIKMKYRLVAYLLILGQNEKALKQFSDCLSQDFDLHKELLEYHPELSDMTEFISLIENFNI